MDKLLRYNLINKCKMTFNPLSNPQNHQSHQAWLYVTAQLVKICTTRSPTSI